MRNQTDILLLKIADGLSELVKNPDLKSKIADAYKLSEDEQKRYEEAQLTIANAEVAKKEIYEQKRLIAQTEDRISAAKLIEERNATCMKDLDAKKRLLDAQQENLNKKEKELLNYSEELNDKSDAIKLGEESLKAKEAGLKEYENSLRAAAAKSQEALAGL